MQAASHSIAPVMAEVMARHIDTEAVIGYGVALNPNQFVYEWVRQNFGGVDKDSLKVGLDTFHKLVIR